MKIRGDYIFLIIVFILYVLISFFDYGKFMEITIKCFQYLIELAPLFLIIFVFLFFTNYFVNIEVLKKYLGEESGLRGWLISILGGIISVGPSYARYPILEEFKKKGVKSRYIATFLYNRGIKLHFYPVLIMYFGLTYSILLLIVMAIMSIPQGLIVEKLEKNKILSI